MYDLASPDVIQSEAYQALRSNASAHEQSIISRLPVLHRTVYSFFASLSKPGVTSEFPPAKYILAAGIEPQNTEIEEDQNKWYAEEHLELLSKVPGFLRARRFKLVSHAELAGKAEGNPTKPSEYLTLYDWDRDTFMESQEFKHALSTPWSVKVMTAVNPDLKKYSLHRSFSK
jgi:hypothetical protein